MTKTTTKYRTFGVAAIVAILSVSLVAIALSQSAIAAPANKSSFGGEGVAVIKVGEWTEIVSGYIKTSTPSDLLVAHNQECSIHTGLNLDKNNEDLTSAIREDVRLIVTDEDGVSNLRYINPVPLYAEYEKDAAVTMCGRAYSISTNILSDIWELCQFTKVLNDGVPVCGEEEPFFESYIRTKSAHGWDWVVPNLGAGVHKITVEAYLTEELDGLQTTNQKGKKTATDTGACTNDKEEPCVDTILEVGKRSLIVTEEKFASTVVVQGG